MHEKVLDMNGVYGCGNRSRIPRYIRVSDFADSDRNIDLLGPISMESLEDSSLQVYVHQCVLHLQVMSTNLQTKMSHKSTYMASH